MIDIIGYILFVLMFVLVPLCLILFIMVAVMDFIDDIKFQKNNKMK